MVTQHVIPAIIPDSYDRLEMRLREIRGVVHAVQVDVMDGTYAPTTSWPYFGVEREAFEAVRREDEGLPYWQDFDIEIDLMVRGPERHIEAWALAGASRVIIHVESTDDLVGAVRQCLDRRLEVGLALKPSTDIKALAYHVDDVVFVQCMGSERIGYHGEQLDRTVLDKIRAIKQKWPKLPVAVDIGVNETTLPQLAAAGAERFAAGSAVFGAGEPVRDFQHLESLAFDVLHRPRA